MELELARAFASPSTVIARKLPRCELGVMPATAYIFP